MIRAGGFLMIGCVGWYTINIGRVAWGQGNKPGALLVWSLALVAVLFPALLLLLGT